ncbi:serine hydrolase [Zoogloea sp. LCSB751]|uniref:serine hydrolase domain-containing protein n=1 Tax=Zoogloea sp. LCSB751 TaxID=1965277 RepID=UPI0013747C30|nr:serine hydrolase domain-containing protein [Zoogloea sp. LCSB751]
MAVYGFSLARAGILAAALLLAGCAAAPSRPLELVRNDDARVQDYATRLIEHEMRKQSIVGLSVAVVDDQKLLWARGFGFADREKGVPATPATLYRVGSISKLFTDSAAMQLAEQGRLDIDAPLNRVLPGFSIRSRFADAPPITLRGLMTHHAGLPRDYLKDFFTETPPPFTSVIPLLADTDTAYAPGTVLSYSNLGITLVGAAVERAAGQPFAEHLRTSLLAPLGMAEASFSAGPSASPLMARGYDKGQLRDEPALRDVPAGGLNASVTDLARFASMVFADGQAQGGQVLKAATVAEMLRPQNADVPLDLDGRIGIGWFIGKPLLRHGGKVVHHGGATYNFHSTLVALPEHKLAVVVLSNSAGSAAAVDRIATEVLSVVLEARSGLRPPPVAVPAAAGPLPEAEATRWEGDYATLFGYVRVERRGNALSAEVLGTRLDLAPRADGRLGLGYRLLGLFPVGLGEIGQSGLSRRTVAGREVLVAERQGLEALVGEKLPPPAQPGWVRPYLGRYAISNLGKDVPLFKEIRVRESAGYPLLEVQVQNGPPVRQVLLPQGEDRALILGSLADSGETVHCRKANDTVECRFAGYVLTRVGD